MHRAGLKKRYVLLDDGNGASLICYAEKGSKVAEQPSIVFIHGFSSDKSTWLGIIKVSDYLYYIKANI
jgi:pimeloyl-ACP methyl ester carboxylesterase